MAQCKQCNSTDLRKNGSSRGIKKYLCKQCGFQFSRTPVRGLTLNEKLTVLFLYVNGMSVRAIARLKKVSPPTVLNWIRKYSKLMGEKLSPEGKNVVVEIDEMWHYFKKTAKTLDFQSLLSYQWATH